MIGKFLVGFIAVWSYLGVSSVLWAKSDGTQLFREGQQAMQRGQYAEALALLQLAAKELPHWGLVHLELAQAMYQNSLDEKAIAHTLQTAEKLIPHNPRLHLWAGFFWEGKGHSGRALQHYKQAMHLGHTSPEACLRAAQLWLTQKQPQPAIACLRKVLNISQAKVAAHRLLAQAYEQDGNIEQAAKYWLLFLALQPDTIPRLQQVYLFFARHANARPNNQRKTWNRTMSNLQQRIARLMPKDNQRTMRPLRPSRDLRK
jgi:tetratricopeptide (TPR) repeat protein